jgi:hypothetical protein
MTDSRLFDSLMVVAYTHIGARHYHLCYHISLLLTLANDRITYRLSIAAIVKCAMCCYPVCLPPLTLYAWRTMIRVMGSIMIVMV